MTAAVLTAEELGIRTARGEALLDNVSVTIRVGEVVAIVGPSGAGKTTLLQALAGLRKPSRGDVTRRHDAASAGYVPQDDIVHGELTVAEAVRYAAQLRYGRAVSGAALDVLVAETLDELGLTGRADVPVASVSGGQRKRVSIATELVSRPAVFFLDEPTSGLDPASAAELMDTLHALAGNGSAVVMTTHNLADLRVADRLIVLAPGGRLDYDGPANRSPEPYRAFATEPGALVHPGTVARRPIARPAAPRRVQTAVLTRRNLTVLARNKMSAAIMAGSPVAVVAMMAVLFRPHAAGPTSIDPSVASALSYWLAFAGFFFGLTFGLLQISGELPIVRRELHATVDIDAYLAAKTCVLLPVLAAVDMAMVVVLVAIGRITSVGAHDLAALLGLLALGSLAGLAIGLLASATVTGPVQATLALPMLCFPAVLFGGAIVPVGSMTAVGRGLAAFTSTRWSFDAITTVLVPGAPGGLLRPSLTLAAIAAVAAVGARAVLDRRTRPRR